MDNKSIINCPACGKEMKKIHIKEENIDLDICLDGCGGIFFDNRELDKFDENNNSIAEILYAINNKNFENVDTKAERKCPICGVPMVKLGSLTEAEIDSCNICGANFLDHGELTKLRELNAKDNAQVEECLAKIEALMPKQSSLSNSRSRQNVENIIKKLILS